MNFEPWKSKSLDYKNISCFMFHIGVHLFSLELRLIGYLTHFSYIKKNLKKKKKKIEMKNAKEKIKRKEEEEEEI